MTALYLDKGLSINDVQTLGLVQQQTLPKQNPLFINKFIKEPHFHVYSNLDAYSEL